MPDQTVVLEKLEWQQLLQVLCTTKDHPWVITNPLIMKVGQQLEAQTPAPGPYTALSTGLVRPNGLDPEVDPAASAPSRRPS